MNNTLSSILYDHKQIGWKRGASYDAQIRAPAYKLFHTGPISVYDWRRKQNEIKKPDPKNVSRASRFFESPPKQYEKRSDSYNPFIANRTGVFNGLSTQPLKNMNATFNIDRNSKQYKAFFEDTVALQGFKPEQAQRIEKLREDQGYNNRDPAGKHNSGFFPVSQK